MATNGGCSNIGVSGRGPRTISGTHVHTPDLAPAEDVGGRGGLHPAIRLRAHVPLDQGPVLEFAIRLKEVVRPWSDPTAVPHPIASDAV
jgi:hypothetical protein